MLQIETESMQKELLTKQPLGIMITIIITIISVIIIIIRIILIYVHFIHFDSINKLSTIEVGAEI